MLCLFGNVFEENPEILFPELMDGLPRINMDNQRWWVGGAEGGEGEVNPIKIRWLWISSSPNFNFFRDFINELSVG